MSHAPEQTWDPGRCPLCGQANGCAMACAKGHPSEEPCWCVTATFSPQLMQRLPPQAQGQACICSACAQADAADR